MNEGGSCFIWVWSLVSMAAIPIRTTESGFGQVSRVLGLLGVTRVNSDQMASRSGPGRSLPPYQKRPIETCL